MPDKLTCDYLILTALDDERDALFRAFETVGAIGPNRERTPNAPTFFEWRVNHPRGELRVPTSSLLDMGNEGAREYTKQILNSVECSFLGFIGIAGAADDLTKPGSILLADHVWHYEFAKVKDT